MGSKEDTMKNIEKVYQALLTLHKQGNDVMTQSLAQILKMDRTLVSRLLNELVETGYIMKQGKRTVLYIPVNIKAQAAESESIFDTMIGADSSLRFGIEQCKSAVIYPNSGYDYHRK